MDTPATILLLNCLQILERTCYMEPEECLFIKWTMLSDQQIRAHTTSTVAFNCFTSRCFRFSKQIRLKSTKNYREIYSQMVRARERIVLPASTSLYISFIFVGQTSHAFFNLIWFPYRETLTNNYFQSSEVWIMAPSCIQKNISNLMPINYFNC